LELGGWCCGEVYDLRFGLVVSRVKGEGYLLFGLLSRALLHCLTYLMAGFLDTALVIARRMPFVGVT